MQDASKARKYSRANIPKSIPIEVAGIQSEVTALGFGGLYIKSASLLPVGTVLNLALTLPDGHFPIRVKAKVVYVDQGVGMGIEFIDLKTRDAEQIGVFLFTTGSV